MKSISLDSDAASKFVTPVSVGDWTLEEFEISKDELDLFRMRQAFSSSPTAYYDRFLKANYKYIRLTKGGAVWMSNTPMEMGTCREFMRKAHGKVFVAGLGIGVTLLPVLENPDVESVLVCELNKDVIDIWEKSSVNIDKSKLNITHSDVHDVDKIVEKGEKFDTLWFDIWRDICADNYPETKELYKKYRKHINYKNDNRYVGFWMRDYIKKEHFSRFEEAYVY